MQEIDFQRIKQQNEQVILAHGGEICDWLPVLDGNASIRNVNCVARRALVLNAMLQIAFNAPIAIVRQWISDNGLDGTLSHSERAVLAKANEELTQQERTDLYWSIEALWALAWVTGKIDHLAFNEPVGPGLASLMPKLQVNESGNAFLNLAKLRSGEELIRMTDLYSRLHWWTRTVQLHGQPSGDVSMDIIMERRKALEWVINDNESWDDVELST
ncbi:DUF4272 domain-containing protein [Bordetella genomosp. 4]|uniref:DUF4272 domain-containing protein n=1 Tax=Bordetella genomosp. 4 TaxID=463044 RepID=UPI000B9E9EDD|nr:DUF4272 domain-containing protein [Bordetella genomosp. 4]OZI44005.1 hypothetical protein CAL21_18100 [Bordetella genomosp. 4]